ncbi:uncharacterized protein LOC111891054 [Lactuca sativa]|uniref:uncharacterized protein LOC111891054 n=1 Tax=Lactuca sativa TaxID=4236 RepID=UPI000CD96587|nr:uncharacterized protein LOC111891054 [Lactuca sativa]
MSDSGTADFFYREAQRLGYVARLAFKLEVQLLQIQKQYKLITPGSSVVDLGCAPGAWLQNYMAKEGRINCIRRDRYRDFLTEGYFRNKVKNSMAVVVGWFLLTQIIRHRFKKMGGLTRIKDFF